MAFKKLTQKRSRSILAFGDTYSAMLYDYVIANSTDTGQQLDWFAALLAA